MSTDQPNNQEMPQQRSQTTPYKAQPKTTVTEDEVCRGLDDMRILVCAKVAYQSYCEQMYRTRGWHPPCWQDVVENMETLRPWVAFTVGALKGWRNGVTGRYESPCGKESNLSDQSSRARSRHYSKRYTRKYTRELAEGPPSRRTKRVI